MIDPVLAVLAGVLIFQVSISFCSVRFVRGIPRYLLLAIFVLGPLLLAISSWLDYQQLLAVAMSESASAADANFHSETAGFLLIFLVPCAVAGLAGAAMGFLALLFRKRR